MANSKHWVLLLALVTICAGIGRVSSWKSEEFRNCHHTPFCKQGRARKPGTSNLRAIDVALQDGQLTAKLVPKILNPEAEAENALILRMSVYPDGILRFKVDEDEGKDGKRKRFEVPDVLDEDLDDRRLWLQRIEHEQDGVSSVYLTTGYEAVLQHDPLEIYVRRGKHERLVSFNSKGLFHFEQLRDKNEEENWDEHFRSHTDSRPHGPQSISLDVSFHGAKHVYGIPEHATGLALKPTRGPDIDSEPYRLFNLDVFEYISESPFGLYGSIPFMLSHSKEYTTGFFWLNAAEMQIDVLAPGWDGNSASDSDANADGIHTMWMAESGIVDGFFFIGPGPKDVMRQYASLTGTSAMPQLFATAYHQCRWNYRDEEDVSNVDAKFDEFDIPYDVLWLDIEHTDGKRYFTWDNLLFPNPEEMQNKLMAKGRHMVTIVDPHIKRDDGFPLHKEATQKGYYVKNAHGNDFDGWCWPGASSYLDMLNPEIRSWWADKFSLSSYKGSTRSLYIWNDMNEPSVFNGPELTMPRDALHFGDVEHREVHNAYGYFFHMGSADGLLKRGGGNDRPFVLSRAFFAGSQRVGPVWTGDNTADWDQLRVSVPMLLTLGLTGMAFSGADVGGFFGNPEPELLLRWYQLGAYYPFFRGHAHHDTKRREPWLFGERNTALIRECQSIIFSAVLLINPRGKGAVSRNEMEGKTSLWWDMESCPFPSYFDPYMLISMAPALFRNFNITTSAANAGGGCSSLHSHHFSAYEFFSETETELHQTLINSGIGLQQLPPGNNNELEKMMMADVLLWAMETPPPANIIFIVGNVDFCYVFQRLRQRSYNVFLVCQSMGEMPQAMLGGVNGCLGWLSFLRSLQNESQLHFPGGISASDDTFLNPALPTSSTSIHGKEMEESNNESSFDYSEENLFSLKPSIIDGWDSTGNLPPSHRDGWDSTGNLPASHRDGWDSTFNLPPTHRDGWDSTCNFPPTASDGWDGPCNFPLDEKARSPVQPEPRFRGPFIRTRRPRSPASSSSSTPTEKKKTASLEEFKAWLTLVVNGKKHTEEGYNISPIRVDFEKATGKILDEKFLGFPKIINLVEGCKDVAVIREVRRGCHLAFPAKLNEQKNPMPSPGEWNSNQNKKFQSRDKYRAGTNPKPKRKASAEDFRKFIYHMLQTGEFSQGFLMARLPKRFEERTGKILDVDHLGYKRISELVASYSDLVSVHCVGPGPVRIFPSGFVNEPVPNFYPNSNTVDVTSINMDRNPTNLKTKVKVDRPSSGGSCKELIENVYWDENVSYGQSQWPPVTFGCFNPREANTPAFQEYSIKSDSSSPPAGSQVSEWEGQSSNAIGETMSFHGELEGSDFIKQHVSSPLWESNAPIEDLVNAECLIVEAMQNLSIKKENISFCEGPCIPAETGLPDSTPPPSESPDSEPQTGGCNSPLTSLQCRAESSAFLGEELRHGMILDCKQNAQNTSSAGNEEKTGNEEKIISAVSLEGSIIQVAGRGTFFPLPNLTRAESSAFLGEELRHGMILDCKQNAQNTSSAGNEEKTGNEEKIISAVSSAGSIIQVAGRGLKSICELKMWRKN